jgi:26S proteasome regulatory subunit (ATPase 3-interacting protein)
MPPKSEKPAVVSAAEAKDVVATYLQDQNRPYNDKMIYENLHGTIRKKDATSALKDLTAEGLTEEKVNGKQRIYWPDQARLEVLDPAGLAALDADLVGLADQEKQAKEKLGKRKRQNSELTGLASDDQLDRQIAALEKVRAEQAARILELRAAGPSVSRAEYTETQSKLRAGIKIWAQRKRFAPAMVEEIAEGASMASQDIRDEADVEEVPGAKDYDDIRVRWT